MLFASELSTESKGPRIRGWGKWEWLFLILHLITRSLNFGFCTYNFGICWLGSQGNMSTRKRTVLSMNWKLRFPFGHLGFLCRWTNGERGLLYWLGRLISIAKGNMAVAKQQRGLSREPPKCFHARGLKVNGRLQQLTEDRINKDLDTSGIKCRAFPPGKEP